MSAKQVFLKRIWVVYVIFAACATAQQVRAPASTAIADREILQHQKPVGRADTFDVIADGGLQGAGNNDKCVYHPVDAQGHPDHSGCRDEGPAIQRILDAGKRRNIFFETTTTGNTQRCDYYSSIALYWPSGVNIEGGAANIFEPATICFASGVGGINAQANSGYSRMDGVRIEGGDWFVPTALATYVLPTGFGGSGPAADGLVVGGQTSVSNVTVQGFARHCITMDAVKTKGSDATALKNITVSNCRGDGINYNGADGQVGTINVVSSQANQLYGIRTDVFAGYGNVIISPNTQANHHTPILPGVRLGGAVAKMSCVAPTASQLSGLCTVTMTEANNTYSNDRVRFSGISGDPALNAKVFVVTKGGTGTTFTFPYGVAEEIGGGGTVSYDPGYRVWAAAGPIANGGNYGSLGGVQLYLNPYSECTDTMGTFNAGLFGSISINPQGCAPIDGVSIGTWYTNLLINSGTIISEPGNPSSGAPAVATRLGGNTDHFGGSALTFYNKKPGPFGGAGVSNYSSLISKRRSAWGNVSGWWCDQLAGNPGANLFTSDICEADALTATGRSGRTGWGASLFPGGFYLGSPDSGIQYFGQGSAAPTSGSWKKGDIIYNNGLGATSVDGVFLWENTASGTPGTWIARSFGLRSGSADNAVLTGRITLAGGRATYKLTGTYTAAPNCIAQDATTPANTASVSESPTTLTFTGTGNDVIKYICAGGN